MPDDLTRIERDLEDLAVRLRALENIQSPMLARTLEEFRDLQREVREIQKEGSMEARARIVRISDRVHTNSSDIAALEADVKKKADADSVKTLEDDVKKKADAQTLKELGDDRKALVRIALAAVVAALLSLGVSLILRATGGG